MESILTDVMYNGGQTRFIMDTPNYLDNESMLEYALRMADNYSKMYKLNIRKPKGQFFTPKPISEYMANYFTIESNSIRLLDPGSGTGILTAAFCERLLKMNKPIKISIDVYENDLDILPYLTKVLKLCKITLENNGYSMNYHIFQNDFIIHNGNYFSDADLTVKKSPKLYDYIISNPPYYKLNKNSPESIVMRDLVSGQPNIYSFFMALSTKLLRPGGEIVFITPRSFCSGLYYSKFRKWFLNHIELSNIHIFESRKEVFDQDDILQESVIIKGIKGQFPNGHIEISASRNKELRPLRKIKVPKNIVVHHKNGDVFIRIPTSSLDLSIIKIIDQWPNTIQDLGVQISTGPVVPFRTKKYLVLKCLNQSNIVPLLWMHNMKDMNVTWPIPKNRKEMAIVDCEETKAILLPVKNYTLVKRFSSKEQKRRLYASAMIADTFSSLKVGIENHINYLYRQGGDMTIDESLGIAAILNTAIIDNYFRSLNGNTQVNATDLRSMPFPSNEQIIEIGKLVKKHKIYSSGEILDNLITRALGIENNIVKELYKGG